MNTNLNLELSFLSVSVYLIGVLISFAIVSLPFLLHLNKISPIDLLSKNIKIFSESRFYFVILVLFSVVFLFMMSFFLSKSIIISSIFVTILFVIVLFYLHWEQKKFPMVQLRSKTNFTTNTTLLLIK